MSEVSWIPGIAVLAAGLGGGVLLAWRLRRPGKAAAKLQRARDFELKIDDLERRRDDIYRRLRDETGVLSEDERRQLETAAARVLRDLDEAKGQVGSPLAGRSGQAPPVAGAEKSGTKGPLRQSFFARRPLLSGFLLGVGMVSVVAVLIYWAVRDTAGTETVSPAVADEAHQDIELTLQAQAEYDALTMQLEQNPADVGARKRLAVLLLSEEQYFAAFREAQTLLEMDPQDLDGLYVEAVVRLQMGQVEPALAKLDEVLSLYPDHVQALAWRGILLYQSGDLSAAISSWERGIEAAGGQHPELEQMVTAALEEEAGLVSAPAPSPSRAPQAAPQPAPQAAPQSAPQPAPEQRESVTAAVGDGIAVRIELAAGARNPGGVLFVALRSSAGAPPVAVRRIEQPRFPLDLILAESDSMMGGALPDSGLVTARLDQDGDVSGSQEGDLAGEAEASLGDSVVVPLAP